MRISRMTLSRIQIARFKQPNPKMILQIPRLVSNRAKRFRQLSLVLLIILLPGDCWAISANEIDDFQTSTAEGWSINRGFTPVAVAENEGPAGNGDHALFMSTATMGVTHLLVMNVSQWTGNWTAAGITQVSLDVRNPNAFNLSMRLGIAGPGGASGGGTGDTHVTDAISVAADDAWHTLTFDVLASDFTAIDGANTAAALAGVTQLRFIHNSAVSFVGDTAGGDFYLDNIQAIASPATVEGDYNGNGVVDAADYVVWRKGGSLQNEVATIGSVTPEDYMQWRLRFGNIAASGSSGVWPAVPEPATWLMLLSVFSVVFGCGARIDRRMVFWSSRS
jgi:hypothetical protein